MKNTTLAILLVLFTTGITFSQSKSVGTITQNQNIAPNGTNNYSSPPLSQELQNLYKELKKAKNDGSRAQIKFYQDKINAITGSTRAGFTPITNVAFSQGSNGDNFNYTAINSTHAVRSSAIATDRITGIIYAAYTRYVVGESDEMWFYKSTNNGLTWTNFHHLAFPEYTELDYNLNEFDMEVINDGDSVCIWGIAGAYITGSFTTGVIFRMRADGTEFNSGVLNTDDPSLNFRFPRITSDASRYTAGSYIYLMYTQDSTVAGSKYLKSKYFYVSNPFDRKPDIHEVSNTSNGSYFYSTPTPSGDSSYMQNDLAYVNTPGDSDLIVTATVIRGNSSFSGQTIFMTTSSHYGEGVDYSYNIADIKYLQFPRVASTGYQNRNVMVGARRLYTNGDWDAYYYYATNYSRNSATFSLSGYLDNSPDTTQTIDLKARGGSFNNFLFAYANKNGATGSTVHGSLFKGGALQTAFTANPPGLYGTGSFGAPVAAFRNVSNDSCLIGWGSSTGIGYYVTGGSSGEYVGINNNSITAREFALVQNYPNPFNPATKISFNVQKNTFVKLTVYDIMGKEISKLVNGIITAGMHSIEFNAMALPSGVYYYKLDANGFSDVKKMMLVK